jgi:hypothetical protein
MLRRHLLFVAMLTIKSAPQRVVAARGGRSIHWCVAAFLAYQARGHMRHIDGSLLARLIRLCRVNPFILAPGL